MLQTAPADLVLTDIHMPDMDGSSSRATCSSYRIRRW